MPGQYCFGLAVMHGDICFVTPEGDPGACRLSLRIARDGYDKESSRALYLLCYMRLAQELHLQRRQLPRIFRR
jgi:hypothetical protein